MGPKTEFDRENVMVRGLDCKLRVRDCASRDGYRWHGKPVLSFMLSTIVVRTIIRTIVRTTVPFHSSRFLLPLFLTRYTD